MWWRLFLEKLPLLVTGWAVSVETLYFSEVVGAVEPPWSERFGVALSGYLSYVEKTFWPVDLACLYPYAVPPHQRVVMAAIVLGIITAGLLCLARARPALIVGWLWFLGTLVPNSGIVQSGEQAFADRFTYLPHLGLAITITWGLGALSRQIRIPAWISAILTGVVLLIFAGLSWRQVWYWQDTGTLFNHALSITEPTATAHLALGVHSFRQGDLEAAAFHLEESLKLDPNRNQTKMIYAEALLARRRPAEAYFELANAQAADPNSLFLMGAALAELGRWRSARELLQRSIKAWPANAANDPRIGHHLRGGTARRLADPHWMLGEITLREGDPEKALEHLDAALAIMPKLAEAYQDKGIALGRLGRWADAQAALQTAVALDPARPASRGYLAAAYNRMKNEESAAREYAELLARFPDWRTSTDAAAIKFVTNARFLDHPRALELAEQACEATAFKDVHALDTLAAVAAATADFAKAQEIVRRALALNPSPEVVRQLDARLRLYESNQALRVQPDGK